MRNGIPAILLYAALFLAACSRPSNPPAALKKFPLDDLQGLIAQSGIQFDRQVSSDSKGSLRIDATEPITVPLFEVHGIDIDDARLIYHARVRTEKVFGQVYLEMLCHFPGKGEYFSRGQATLLSGTTGWTTQETYFFLQKGEKPDYVMLNLVINGRGTAWIDDIELLCTPLK